MNENDDLRKSPAYAHLIGEDLSTLSIEELQARIKVLETEIMRLNAAITTKNASRLAADQFFKR
jgi:uncharacterized small protein (DUF1192 family)